MATTSLEAIRRITIEAQEKGLADVAAKLDKIAKAQEGVAATATTVMKSGGSVEQAFKRTERSLDSNVVAYQRYASAVKAVSDAQAQGLVTQQRSAELFSLAEARLQKATGTMNNLGKATAGPAQHELINLSRQLQDVGVGLAGGQGLFTIIAQQGPQIADVIGTSKASLGDFVSTAVSGAGRFLAAWGPVIAGIAAVGGAAAAAMHVLAQQREARIATTSGQGRLSGISADQVPELAERGRTQGMSLGEAREGVLEFVKAGASANTMLEAMAVATRVAATTGTSLADAYKMLAGVIRDPTAAAKQLDDQFQILDRSQQRNIAALQATGDRAGAASQVIRALSGALVSGKDATTAWTDVWAGFVTQVQRGIDVLGRIATMQQPPATSEAGKRATEQEQAIKMKPGFATAIPGESARTLVDPAAAQQSAQAVQAAVASVTAYEAEVVKATRASNDMLSSIADSARAFELQKNVMMATTVEQRAAATEAQTLNQLTQGQVATTQQLAQAIQAGNEVRAQSTAQQTQAIFVQQQELAMSQQLIAAAGMLGAAGAQRRAELQQTIALEQQGVDSSTRLSQAQIAQAGATAQLNLATQDASQAAQVETQIQGQIKMYEAQAAAVGKSASQKAAIISLAQSEVQAMAAEAQGFTETAAKIRAYAQALADAAAAAAYAQEIQQNKELQASLQGTLDMKRLEISLVGASSEAHAYYTTLLQYENQAKLAEVQGNQLAADSYREYGRAIANATYQLEQRKRVLQETQAAEAAAAQSRAAQRSQEIAKDEAFKKDPKAGGFTSDIMGSFGQITEKDRAAAEAAAGEAQRIAEVQKAAQQKQLQFASSAIQDQISALQDQKSALDDNTKTLQDNISALEKQTQKRREQLDKEIAKLEKALSPSRPDPYAERNPDYFYRFGTQAFKENDPMQALLSAAEAERDGLDNQLDVMKEQLDQQQAAVELQQKAIDEQIQGYERQAKELNRVSNLLSNDVALSAQEVAGIQGIIAAIRGLGDYSRLQAVNVQQTAASSIPTGQYNDPKIVGGGGGGGKISQYGFEGGYKGFFASGGYIPPGSWGIAGESGPEIITKKRAVAGPATVTPIRAGGDRPIVVNQTIVSQGGMRELRASRGEMAQSSAANLRRSLRMQ